MKSKSIIKQPAYHTVEKVTGKFIQCRVNLLDAG